VSVGGSKLDTPVLSQERKIMGGGINKWIVLDGTPYPAWVDVITGLLNRDHSIRLSNAETLKLHGVQVILILIVIYCTII